MPRQRRKSIIWIAWRRRSWEEKKKDILSNRTNYRKDHVCSSSLTLGCGSVAQLSSRCTAPLPMFNACCRK